MSFYKILSRLLSIGLFLFIILIPLLFWGDNYFASGDDSKLYYYYPYEFLTNFSSKIITDNSLGYVSRYVSQSYTWPFVFFLYVLKTIIPINTQLLAYGLNIGLGFLGMYLLLKFFLYDSENKELIAILGSLIYITSIFTYFTLWSHQLFAIYIISVVPLSFWLFIKSCLEKSILNRYLLSLILLFAVFSIVILSLPWFIPSIFPLLIILSTFLLKRKKRVFFTILLSIFLIFLTNSHWIVPQIHSTIYGSLNANDKFSEINNIDNLENNEKLIKGISSQNSLFYPLVYLFHKDLQINNGWQTLDLFESWYLQFFILYISIPIIIIYAAIINSKRTLEKYFNLTLLAWLVSIYFFTVNIGSWGIPFFIWLNNNLPLFGMFRNMYDKFSISIALSSSILLSLSISIIIKNSKSIVFKKIILLYFFVIVLVSSFPFISGFILKTKVANTNYSREFVGFNKDYDEMIAYLSTFPGSSKFIWLPINDANYVIISNKDHNYYYIGVSPLQFLANKSDFTGINSFGANNKLEVRNIFKNRNVKKTLELLEKNNINYIILNREIPNQILNSYIFSDDLAIRLDNDSDQEYIKNLVGKHVADFGDKYSIYEINKDYLSDTITSINSSDIIQNKITSFDYQFKLVDSETTQRINFMEPFNKGWSLRDDKYRLVDLQNISKKENMNSWEINTNGEKESTYHIYFSPQDIFKNMVILSSITFVSISLLLMYKLFRNE